MARHHLVPQMYLRNFADDANRLTMVARNDLARALTVTVNNACNEVGFYTIPTEDIEPHARTGHDPEALEKTLSVLEGTAVPIIDKIVATKTLPSLDDQTHQQGLDAPWDRYNLAFFVAIQLTRTWAFRRDLKELIDHSVQRRKEAFTTDKRVAKYLARQGMPTRPQDIQAFRERLIGPNGPKLDFGDSRTIQAAAYFAVEYGLPELFERTWRLRVFDDPVLLTSDAPVALRTAGPAGTLTPGVANAEAIYWPIDRNHLLTFELPAGGPDRVDLHANPGRARLVNQLVASQSERWIFHHPDDRPLDGLELRPRSELVEETVRVVEGPEEIRVTKRLARRQPS